MAFLNDVKFTSTTSGTADFGIGAAVTGFQLPSAAGAVNGSTYSYTARTAVGQFESGRGAWSSSGNTISRTTILDTSSGTGTKVNFSTAPTVILTALASDLDIAGTTIATLKYRVGVDSSGNIGRSGEVAWPPHRAACIGDSITGLNIIDDGTHYGYQHSGYLSAFNNRYGHKLFLDPALNKGVSGNTTTQMVARFSADIAANYDSFDLCCIEGGVNDFDNSISAATTLANLQSMATALLQNGKWVLLFTLPPNSAGGANANRTARYLQVNALLRNWVKTVSSKCPLFLVDTWRDEVDPASATGAPATGNTVDGIHLSGGGSSLWSRRMDATFGSWLSPLDFGLSSQVESYDASLNPLGNLLPNSGFATTSGGGASGVGGTIVGSWTAERDGGSFTNVEVVGSVVTTSAGFGAAGGNKQRFTISIAGKTSNELLNFWAQASAVTPGNSYVLNAKVDVSNVSNLYKVLADLYFDGPSPRDAVDGWNATGSSDLLATDARTITLRTPPFTAPAGCTGMYAYFTIVLDGTVSASVTMDIYDVMLRQVT